LNLNELGWGPRQLSHLDLSFTEDEVKVVINSATKESIWARWVYWTALLQLLDHYQVGHDPGS
jgi:hypothetical protein